jgi:probable rRNA maturation factor
MKKTDVTVVRSAPGIRFFSGDVIRTVERVFSGERIRGRMVTVILTRSAFIRRINKIFLSHDTPTDVIAFPLHDAEGTPDEVYVNADYARAQAREYGVTFRSEMHRLIIHGCLHLCGYRDGSARGKRRMHEREDRYIGLLLDNVK